jgi:hypothetical protein
VDQRIGDKVGVMVTPPRPRAADGVRGEEEEFDVRGEKLDGTEESSVGEEA